MPAASPKISLAEVAAKAKAEARLGTVVSGRYRLTEVIAMGGVGVVFKAEHVHMRKWVAVKILHPDAQNAPDLVSRFQREAVAGAHIQHPNVTAATDFGELEDGDFFLVLELVKGSTLRDIIKRGPLPVKRAVGIARQLAEALVATHAIGIVHRDLTPRNVMVVEGASRSVPPAGSTPPPPSVGSGEAAERDVVKLIDFGLAKLDSEKLADFGASRTSGPDFSITGTGAVFGTIAYLAPEVAAGMDAIDARADLYALGLVLYEMLAGVHCFNTTDAVELFKRHATVKPPPIATRAPGVQVPAALEAVIMRLLEKAKDKRYASAEELIAALDAAMLTPEPPIATPTPSPVTLTTPPPEAAVSVAVPASTPAPAPVKAQPAPVEALVVAEPVLPARSMAIGAGLAVLLLLGVGGFWFLRGAASDEPAAAGSSSVGASASAPVASASAGVAASAAGSAVKAPPAPLKAGPPDPVARAAFKAPLGTRDFTHAGPPFLALVDKDPAAFKDPVIAMGARDVAVALAGNPEGDPIFDALATKLGGPGVDVLFEIIRTRGGSKASARAEKLLADPEVLGRGSSALRITYELTTAPCAAKLGLLDRAVAEGDARTLMALEGAQSSCFRQNKALDDAIKNLRQRIAR